MASTHPPFGLVLVRDTQTLGAEPYFHDLIAGIEEITLSQGFPVLLSVLESRQNEADRYRVWATRAAVSGMFLVDIEVSDPRPALVRSLGLPTVVVGPPEWPDLMTVWTDDDNAMTSVVDHLAELGHRELLHVGGLVHMAHSAVRRHAFLAACRRHSIVARLADGDYSRSSGQAETARTLATDPGISAAVYDSDLMALGGLDAATNLGRQVPTDLAIIAWDDSSQAQLCVPALTAVARDTRAVGRQIGQAMLDVIAGLPNEVRHAAPAALAIRASTDPQIAFT